MREEKIKAKREKKEERRIDEKRRGQCIECDQST